MRPWLIELETCPSTNTWTLARSEALAHGACVWTRRQTAGRGRGSNRWLAPEGVLTASFVLHQRQATPQIALASGLALCHAIEDCCPKLQIGLKWPNDLVVIRDGIPGKLAGILCERAANGAVVVGVGLNLDPRWDSDRDSLLLAVGRTYPPTSLAEHGSTPDYLPMLDCIRRYLLEAAGMVQAGQWHRIVDSWRVRDVLYGRDLVVATGSKSLSGTGTGIDDQGRLTMARSEGPVALTSGSVTAW